MTDATDPEFDATGRAGDPMFEILDATGEDVVAVRVGHGTRSGYRELYDLLVEKTEEHGTVHVYEAGVNWTMSTYLSHLHGIVPDLREGPKFDVGRYAAVGDSRWLHLLFTQWVAIAPVWPVAPREMRHYSVADRTRALAWVKTGEKRTAPTTGGGGDQ